VLATLVCSLAAGFIIVRMVWRAVVVRSGMRTVVVSPGGPEGFGNELKR